MNVDLISEDDLKRFKIELLNEIGELLRDHQPTFKEFLTGKEVREILGISIGTLLNYRTTGRLSYSKINGKIYYQYADLKQLIDENKINSLSKFQDGKV